MKLTRDVVIALVLLVLCGAFWGASYTIPEMGFQTMGSAIWPRIIIVALGVMSVIYLIGSLRAAPEGGAPGQRDGGGLAGWLTRYRNPILCFALFFLFLVTLPTLGMLIGGSLFVFLSLAALGERSLRALAIDAAIAVVMVGAMWAIFTFGLGVILPEGEILRIL